VNGKSVLIAAAMVIVLVIVSGVAISAQDKYTLKLPDGVPFSDWKGYEDWQLISTSKTDDRLKVILDNPTIIPAFKSGIPSNGKPFPERLQDRKGPVETKEEHGSPVCRRRAGHFGRPFLHGERQQEIPGDWRMGLRPV